MFDNFIDQIPNAIHFALPDNAVLLDDNLKGLVNSELRLPFPSITIEYFVPDSEENLAGIAVGHSPRRVALVRELPVETIKRWALQHHVPDNRYDDLFTDDIAILLLVACEMAGQWVAMPAGFVFNRTWTKVTSNAVMLPSDFTHKPDAIQFGGQLFPLLPTLIAAQAKKYGMEDTRKAAYMDISGEISALLALCEALTCSNVGTEDLQTGDPKVNARRAQNKKLPIYTTKILTINTKEGGKKSGDYTPGSGTSPRQHLRRGHIRRLQSGEKIWVNSCVVGDRENGFIEKSYRVK